MIVERVYASLLFVLLAVLGGTDCRADDPPASAIASVGGVEFEIEVAHTPSDRARGLSNRDSLPQMAGMLFVFESGEASSFWMKEMRFPLDFIWIGRDCRVVDTTVDVPPPAPGSPGSPLPTYESDAPAVYTLEVNAGEVRELGVRIGDSVRFSGLPDGVKGAYC